MTGDRIALALERIADALERIAQLGPEPAPSLSHPSPAVLEMPVQELEVSARLWNCLKRTPCRTMGDLIQQTELELQLIKGFGKGCLRELKEVLSLWQLSLGTRYDAESGRFVPVSRTWEERVENVKRLNGGI